MPLSHKTIFESSNGGKLDGIEVVFEPVLG
jgi:hypothetical protein